jgi:hypothetical protein
MKTFEIKKRILVTLWLCSVLIFLTSCDSMRKGLDSSGIEDVEKAILADWRPGTVHDLSEYLSSPEFTSYKSVPNTSISITPLSRWLLAQPKTTSFIQERLSFPSSIRGSTSDEAVFYLYRNGPWSGQRVILWIPGFGVSDLAFEFIRKFFYEELDAGYAIMFYDIPFHLERIEKGKKQGEGFITSNIVSNLKTFHSCVAEIMTGIDYLRSKGVRSLSGWGGSIGAAMLWEISSRIKIEHMTLMIPIVDWNTIMLGQGFSKVVARYESSGFDRELIRNTYELISPRSIPTLTDSSRILILCAKDDQLTPESAVLSFADAKGIVNVKVYEESHSTILCNSRMYADYARFLRSMSAN